MRDLGLCLDEGKLLSEPLCADYCLQIVGGVACKEVADVLHARCVKADDTGVHSPLEGVVDALRRAHGNSIAVVLVGSASRNAWTPGSDIDLLVVAKEEPSALPLISGFHIQAASEWEFRQNLQRGEDFEAWCVRLGRPLYDDGTWLRISQSPDAQTWPEWRLKVTHGVRRLFLAHSMLRIGDKDAAREEAVYVLGHIARGLLLKSNVFPLSRPELAGQVRVIGYPHLAEIHERLRGSEDVPSRVIALALRYAKKLLLHLDLEIYRRCAEEYRSRQREKGRKGRRRRADADV